MSAYFVSVLARALRRFPEMNSSWSEEGMILHPEVNVGLAVSLGDGGLIVPVLGAPTPSTWRRRREE